MKLNDEQKFQLLLEVLKERYNSASHMRARSTQFTLWISGMAIGLAWILVSRESILVSQRLSITGLIVTLAGGSGYFLVALARGLNSNRRIMIKTERALSLFEPGIFVPDSSLLPVEYNSLNHKWSHHSVIHAVWLLLIAISLLTLTWIHPIVFEPTINPEIKQMKEQNHDHNATGRL